MASLSSPPPTLASCTLYCAMDPVLGHILVFYGPQAPAHIEAHILSCAGFQSYPKLTLAPTSPLYAAVNHLPLQKQASDVHCGLAIAVLKYFADLSKAAKETILRSKSNVATTGEGQAVAFDEMHAGDLAARLKEFESESLASDLTCALAERFVGSLDLDIVLWSHDEQEIAEDTVPEDVQRFLRCFGEPTYLPFTKLKRSWSRPATARPKSLKDTSEALERELDELRHTEENYVAKLRELSEEIVKPLKRRRSESSSSITLRDLENLFPPCLERIIETNALFLEGIKTGGIEKVSKCCLEIFPTFEKPYKEYIQASADFPHLISKLIKNKDSSFSRRLQQTGEQRLRSLIIEPVQRLPRYSLLIDNMINLLSSDHTSFGQLTNARNIVAEICSLQSSERDERTATIKRLQSIILSWPSSLQPKGRLITAIDFLDILPPYNDSSSEAISSILLLFPDCAVILRRCKSTSLLARGVMAEVDKPGGPGGGSGAGFSHGSGSKRDALGGHDLQFAGWIDLSEVRLAGSDVGTIVWMTLASNLKDGWDVRAGGIGLRKMRLLNQYEGRAHKVEDEFTKARLERRIGSKPRGILGIREAKYEGLVLWSCVWGSRSQYSESLHKGSAVVFLDTGICSVSKTSAVRELAAETVGKGDGVDIAFSLEETKSNKLLRLECRSWNEYSSTDSVPEDELLAVFTMRIASLLRLHALPQHPPATAALLSANRKLLRSLNIPFEGESRFSKLRPPSPVKLISSILNTPGSPAKTKPVLVDRPQSRMLPPRERPISMLQRGVTALGITDEQRVENGEGRQKITMATDSPLWRLEDTFEAFVNAIRMVGSSGVDLRPLHEVYKVDEDAVELLLKQLVADPRTVRVGKDMGIDVVFVAFSRFLGGEWREGMGPVISHESLLELQHKSETLYSGDFEDFFRIAILDWTPQNKRAFRTIMFLLHEMQSKVEGEDDKGMFTKAFTELLVGTEVNALEYMGLVDSLVDNMENLFNENTLFENRHLKRAKSVNNSSGGSPASLRKRFGLGHSSSVREPVSDRSVDGSEHKSHSVWRTLSKRDKDGMKGYLNRSKSIDYDARTREIQSTKRPGSRDRPALSGLLGNPPSPAVPAYPQTPAKARPLSSILASPIVLIPGTSSSGSGPRRKRRSSLSDLINHPDYQQLGTPDLSLTSLRSPMALDLHIDPDRDSPPSPMNKLHIDPVKGSERTDRNIPPSTPKREIPRQSIGPASSTPGTQRLKMQSPQKLRERLQTEKQAFNKIDAALQHEIDLIGAELSMAMNPSSTSSRASAQADKFKVLVNRLNQLETKVAEGKAIGFAGSPSHLRPSTPSTPSTPPGAVTGVRKELQRKEKELQRVDKLVNDCQAENDVMFEKFNEELGKMSNGLKLGKGESEVLKILQEATAEQGRLKRENMRLRRENIALRSQMEMATQK